MELLQNTTSKELFCDFLKNKGLHHSGSWSDLITKRVIPYIDDKKITVEELVSLLSDSDEHGRQHVFLYQIRSKAFDALRKDKLIPVLKANNLDKLLTSPLILDKPETPTISDIRWENNESELIIKVISTSQKYESVSEEHTDDDHFIKKFKRITTRSVNIVKLHSNGLVEVRISSKSNSTKYFEDVENLLHSLKAIIPYKEITSSPVNLLRAKKQIMGRKRFII
jgi:hypothetical protein